MFAESAFDALIDEAVANQLHALDVLEVSMRIVGDDNAWVQNAIGIEEILQPGHDAVGLGSPLLFDKWGNRSSGPVLGLERPIEFENQLEDAFEEFAQLGHSIGVSHIVGNQEVHIAGFAMTLDDAAVVAVLDEEVAQPGDQVR